MSVCTRIASTEHPLALTRPDADAASPGFGSSTCLVILPSSVALAPSLLRSFGVRATFLFSFSHSFCILWHAPTPPSPLALSRPLTDSPPPRVCSRPCSRSFSRPSTHPARSRSFPLPPLYIRRAAATLRYSPAGRPFGLAGAGNGEPNRHHPFDSLVVVVAFRSIARRRASPRLPAFPCPAPHLISPSSCLPPTSPP